MAYLNHDLTELNEDKVLSKRVPTSAVFTLQMEMPGSKLLTDGVHTIGFLEANVTITKVVIITKAVFDGTAPTVTITEEQGGTTETWLTDVDLAIEAVEEAGLTAPTLTGKQAPYYRSTKSEWFADINTGDSTVGEFALLIDYVQMDAEPGKHS